MKIGILTLPFTWNYGGLLQAFALQKVFHNLGHEVVIINRRQNRDNILIRLIVWLKWSLIKILRNFKIFQFIPLVAAEVFKKQNFRCITSNIFSDKGVRKMADSNKLNAYVVGSDQVWNYGYPPHLYNYFLDFTEGEDVVRLAYAASFGREGWHFSAEETLACSKLVKKFDGVSVREKSGVELCEKHLRVDAHHHLDPTLLLEKEDYIEIIQKSKTSPTNGKLLLYILDRSGENEKIIDKVKGITGLTPFAVKQGKTSTLIKNALKGIYPSVNQWLKSFYDAEFVITDSFHGTVFSIIFNKPFIAIGNRKRGLARFNSLLKMFELEGRLIANVTDISEEQINTPIDWLKVNEEIYAQKLKGVQYLNKHLK
ncbi:polysaccharide pyruvyl transferase family protein [Maribacter polysaccharolyticus]|uniref:polysaccharide pyruvyl transferase family protein n=1 Tax=Maribacter polysaccharolyticus TaxID=3020831 RepID=UPI00237FB1F1|nr:polysaccharide pyruvyl transferase family protein [Maribacter polysaccharolyticus]MDE3741486.1 polysaccharide pyruvyl transferase family protein [Maribacter polysaccharolyticus]